MTMWEDFSTIFNDGILVNAKVLIDFLLGDGIYLVAVVILLPLLGRLIKFFKNLF